MALTQNNRKWWSTRSGRSSVCTTGQQPLCVAFFSARLPAPDPARSSLPVSRQRSLPRRPLNEPVQIPATAVSRTHRQRATSNVKPARIGAGRRIPGARSARRRRTWRADVIQPIVAADIAPGDPGLVGRVERLIASMFDIERDEVAAAEVALSLELATLAAAGSVSACREAAPAAARNAGGDRPELRRRDNSGTRPGGAPSASHWGDGRGVSGVEPAGQPLPPGWRSTAQDGQILEWLAHEWMRRRDAGDVDAFRTLEKWIGHHTVELQNLRETGRWSVWPYNRVLAVTVRPEYRRNLCCELLHLPAPNSDQLLAFQ